MKSRRGTGSIYRRGEVFWIKYYCNGKAYRESSGSTRESNAQKLLRKRLGFISTGKFIGPEADMMTIRELSRDFENDYRVNGRKSLDRAQRAVSQLLAFFGDCRAHNVSTDLIRHYVAIRLDERAANATINRELAALKRMYRWGCKRSGSTVGRTSRCFRRTTFDVGFLNTVNFAPLGPRYLIT